MKKSVRSDFSPTMLHHVKEIQMRLLITVLVLIAGMIVGYVFYEFLFQFIKAPLHGPLHYTSPAGSFSFVIKICLMVGVIATIPVAVYNIIMFVQPALVEKLSKLRVYLTTCMSLLLAAGGAAFAFFVIIPMALEFFFKFQVDGLEALISADDYLRFVVNVIITFVLIFQMPLLISLIDHITPLPPKKLLKAEKFIIVGSVAVGVLVPFALDPVIQLLIASPIIILYNVSIGIVVLQHMYKRRRGMLPDSGMQTAPSPTTASATTQPSAVDPVIPTQAHPAVVRPQTSRRQPVMSPPVQSVRRQMRPSTTNVAGRRQPSSMAVQPGLRRPPVRLISDIRRPASRPMQTPAVVRPDLSSS